jgi:DNA-binding NtrC family response regulator
MDEMIAVLIVDDEERFRHTLTKLLGVKGLTAASVGSGQEALAELGRNRYDVVLLDVRMPGMDGMQTLEGIKRIDPSAEVIILTGHASVDDAVELMRLGGSDYLLKPCPTEELMDKIMLAYERKQEKAGTT